MTEFAMALSNPLSPIEKRLPGFVGMPLPSVEVKIIDEDTSETIASFDSINGQTSKATSEGASQSGELCVRGPTVFSEYWRKPHATAESFDFEGYFKTGDVAEYDPNHESYHILGRVSADLIAPYPPGVAVVAPGEVLTQQIIEGLASSRAAGVRIAYATDSTLAQYRVVLES